MTTDAELEQRICSIIVKGMTDPVLPFTSAQAVLAAVRASGRLATEVQISLTATVIDWVTELEGPPDEQWAGALVRVVATEAEVKAREECAEEIKALKADIRHLKPYKAELRKIAKTLGEPNDPFAAWEALEAIRTGSAS